MKLYTATLDTIEHDVQFEDLLDNLVGTFGFRRDRDLRWLAAEFIPSENDLKLCVSYTERHPAQHPLAFRTVYLEVRDEALETWLLVNCPTDLKLTKVPNQCGRISGGLDVQD